MKKPTPEVPIHEEIYRDVGFKITHTGHMIFDWLPPCDDARWCHWSRFFTQEENVLCTDKSRLTVERVACVHRAIDRALLNNPVWRGDIRDMPQ